MNAHVGECVDGLEGAHGVHGYGERNAVGLTMLEFCDRGEENGLPGMDRKFRRSESGRVVPKDDEMSEANRALATVKAGEWQA